MPNPGADAPLRKVTLNLYEDDCVWMEQHWGHGWSQWVRTEINSEIARLKRLKPTHNRKRLGDLE